MTTDDIPQSFYPDLTRRGIKFLPGLLALLLIGCSMGQLLTLSSTPATVPTVIPTATPTPTATPRPAPPPTPEIFPDDVSLIDAAGLDIAEKQVIEVHKQVSPAVVNITTQVLRRSFFFEIIPEERAGYTACRPQNH
jgi:hypothetical protein